MSDRNTLRHKECLFIVYFATKVRCTALPFIRGPNYSVTLCDELYVVTYSDLMVSVYQHTYCRFIVFIIYVLFYVIQECRIVCV